MLYMNADRVVVVYTSLSCALSKAVRSGSEAKVMGTPPNAGVKLGAGTCSNHVNC